MKIRIITVSGLTIDIDQPPVENFSFNGFFTAIRANGHFMSEELFIPFHALASILHFDPEKLEASPIVMGMTKQ